jgi:hypothetical protein
MAKLYPVGKAQEVTRIPVHPEITKRKEAWDRIETLLEQDEEKIREEFTRRLPNEKGKAYQQRKKYYLDTFQNLTQDLVSAPVNTVFAQGYNLDYDQKEKSIIGEWVKNCTRSGGMPIEQFMKDYVGLELRAYGSVCTVVDKPAFVPKNKAEELENGMPYISNLRLQDIITWQKDGRGHLEWIVYKSTSSEFWEDPFNTTQPKTIEYENLLTKTQLVKRAIGEKNVMVFDHNFGFVPIVIQASFKLREEDLLGNAAMFQSSHSIVNYNHNRNVAQYELNKHGGAVLMHPEDSLTGKSLETDNDGNTEIKKFDGSNITYAGETPPEYLVKELKVEELMKMAENDKQSAMENERDLKSVAKKGTTGKEIQESGFAKILDRNPLIGNLNALAGDLEEWFKNVTDMIALILNIKNDSMFKLDKDYNMKTLADMYGEYKAAKESDIHKITPTLMKEKLKNIVPKEVEDPKIQEVINTEIDNAVFEEPIDEELDKSLNNDFGIFENKKTGEK